MLERDTYPPGVPCWVDTVRPDPRAAVAFYGDLFGWEYDERTPPGSPEPYFVAQIRGRDVAGIGTQPGDAPGDPAWNTYVAVESADDAAAKAKDAGGSVLMGPFDVGEAGRMAVLSDSSGAVICLWQANQSVGSQIVNEPGSWNFSDLHTDDPEGAQAFYGTVFGWEATSFGGDAMFWHMPSYGDFLEQRTPGRRQGMAEMGAPEGFDGSVATLVPGAGGDTPHWGVTFAVADADTTAARAAELGGEVLVPPADAPWVRTTVLRDPQGAVFTASKFVPPES